MRGRMTYGEKGGYHVTLRLRESLPDLSGIERPHPCATEIQVSGGKDDVSSHYGGVSLSPIETITGPGRGIWAPVAHHDHDRSVEHGVDGTDAGKSFLACQRPHMDGLLVLGARSQTGCLQNLGQLDRRDRMMIE